MVEEMATKVAGPFRYKLEAEVYCQQCGMALKLGEMAWKAYGVTLCEDCLKRIEDPERDFRRQKRERDAIVQAPVMPKTDPPSQLVIVVPEQQECLSRSSRLHILFARFSCWLRYQFTSRHHKCLLRIAEREASLLELDEQIRTTPERVEREWQCQQQHALVGVEA